MTLPNPRKPKQRTILLVNPDHDEHVRLIINQGTETLSFFSFKRNDLVTVGPSGAYTDDGLEIWRERAEEKT